MRRGETFLKEENSRSRREKGRGKGERLDTMLTEDSRSGKTGPPPENQPVLREKN